MAMKLIITIDLDNADFTDNPAALGIALRNIAREYEHGIRDNPVRDTNGATCGSWEVEEYVELSHDDADSVKDALVRRGHSTARELVTGIPFGVSGGTATERGYDSRKVRVFAETNLPGSSAICYRGEICGVAATFHGKAHKLP